MNRRRRSERRKDKETFGGASPHIKRSIPFFDILDEDKLEIIEGQVDWLIENIGIAFRDDPAALSIWQRAASMAAAIAIAVRSDPPLPSVVIRPSGLLP